MGNQEEYTAGTDPWDAGERLEVSGVRCQAGDFCLKFLTETGRLYGVVGKGEMTGTSQWAIVTNGMPGTGGYLEVRDPVTGAKKFYRIMVQMQ